MVTESMYEFWLFWILRKNTLLSGLIIIGIFELSGFIVNVLFRLIPQGMPAVMLVKIASEILGGKGGGGRKDFAQAGGSNKGSIEKAFKALNEKIS